ncbi:MAG: phosphonate ABC transporter, permease protein PhnE [Syntrophaceae bacterium CG2_30_49_12]|nr:MAG: phosphonate ABC transporter, permease protein PhnE [Syntrophaceae bacterium CG2_30_49_12]PIP05257.1 MAG: phosphonate ABC transporter, permease protein PhnE [Syntrophobacterales bacterium CG23_combo_of_CG06-09_8_20_14_all_48_27]PJA50530.1 MAG: phosphonate ABC transporter, permease protein PhnE [Syntrophobacterales bacterium CG_4_9_14_3_um_filter_49_8]PJC72955.1 MAG: phosphonate ABC transporter, permease protein PhnE [Syntrophobacterales bacterium CG_4_8_14_3_um_filter_49_14]
MTTVSIWRWPTPSGLPPLSAVASLSAVLVAMWLTAPLVEVDFVRLFGSLGKMVAFAGQLFVEPEWEYLPQLLDKMLETIEMTFLATMIALAVSLPLGLLAARNATPHVLVYRLVRDLLSLMRALPDLVWALVFVSAVGLGPLPGVMALAFVTVGFMGKFFAEIIEVVDHKPVEGVAAHGAGWLQVRLFAMLPQALPDFVGTVMYILDHNLRMATILGLVGAGGIGYDLVMSMRLFQYDRLILIALAIYLVVTLLDRLSDRLRSRIIHGTRA